MNHQRNQSRVRYAHQRRRRATTLSQYRCASCGSNLDVRSYGPIAFCSECRDQAERFTGKELYTDIGGGD